MKKILNRLTNKAICAAFVVLGALTASAELVKTPILQSFEGESEPVSVGYTVSGFENKNEYAVVFTNHTRTATWTVPADLENVQFLVVGGGGGGGASASSSSSSSSSFGGAGGGGGGVVTGSIINVVRKDSILTVGVGEGGQGGLAGKNKDGDEVKTGYRGEAQSKGGYSWFEIDNARYVYVEGGGRDRGVQYKDGSSVIGMTGGNGGSCAGWRRTYDETEAEKFPTNHYTEIDKTYVSVGLSPLGNYGGACWSDKPSAAGGGGGACSEGVASYIEKNSSGATTHWYAGNGGKGLISDITGAPIMYGAGGGGGVARGSNDDKKVTAGSAFDGAGAGAKNGKGEDGSANQGGGGGGGGRAGNGGNGGSGIVVLRYTVPDNVIFVPEIESKVYNGENQTADVPASKGYAVTQSGGMNVGSYDVVLTLNEGYKWTDNSTEPITFKFNITQAENKWESEPSISKGSWTVGEVSGELNCGKTTFGEIIARISKDGVVLGDFDGVIPTDAGEYEITYSVAESINYTNVDSKTVAFTIVAADAIPPYTFSVGEVTVDDNRNLLIPYSLSCEAQTSKKAKIIAVYTIEGSGDNNEFILATNVALNGGAFTGMIPDLKPGATYSVAVYSQVDEEKSGLTEFKTVTVPGVAKNLEASATFVTQPDKKFIVTGSVTPGIGETKVTLHYSLNSKTCNSTKDVKIEEGSDGKFTFEVTYTELTDTFSWYVTVVNIFDTGTWQGDLNGGETTKVTTERKEDAHSKYVWTGNGGDNLWTNPLNWECSNNSCYGYPGVKGINYYSWVEFVSSPSSPIDLGEGVYDFIDNGAFVVGDGVTVEFYNGTLRVHGSKPMNKGDDYKIGRSNSTMTFNEVNIDNLDILQPIAGSTIEFKGTTTQKWKYKPYTGSTSTKFIVRDGVLTTGYSVAQPGSGSEVLISNAVWVVANAIYEKDKKRGLAKVTKFRDGADNQARLLVCKTLTDTTDYALELYGIYDIKIPSDGVTDSYVVADYVSSVENFEKFVIDVTDYAKGDLIPLIYQSGAASGTNTRMETFIAERTDALQLIANGEDVTSERNGRLVWDYEAKTLYFQQDIQAVAQIGDAKFTSLAEAIEAADVNDVIKIVEDFKTSSAIIIEGKSVTIDLNGKTVKANDTDAATDGNGVFWVQAGGVLTLEDSSEDKSGTVDGNGGNGYKMAIWADGGKVVINAGNYVNENDGTHTQYDLIYAKNGGEIVINGGTFKCDTPRWTLNSHNTKTGTFVVTGGKFYQYNPTDFDTDEAVTTWCDAKYRAEADGDWFVIKEGYTVTEESAATVTADTEAEALAQVDFSVITPEGVDAAAYKNYFKLVATETAEGSKTWTVALALNPDVVKPVIAETTADDTTKEAFVIDPYGNVTLNISNKKPGLYYGIQVLAELGADPVAVVPETEDGLVVPAAKLSGANAAFFKVVVDFKPIPEAE